MANELNIRLDPVDDTGLSITGRVRAQGGVQEGSDVVMAEVSSSAYYTGTFSLATVADGIYSVEFIDDGTGNLIGLGELAVKNNAEINITTLNNFNPASDTVVNVTNVATNADMRGTDNALLSSSYTAPDNAGITVNGNAISALNDFNPTTEQVIVATNNDKSGYSISGTKNTLDSLNDITSSEVYTEFTTLSNEDVFKADVSTLATQASVDTIDANVDAVLIDTATTIPAQITALNNFDPSVDTVSHVTLVDTVTSNTDMRGTDGANIVVPDNAGITSNGIAINGLNDIDLATIEGSSVLAKEATVASKASQSSVDTIDANVDSILADTNELQSDWVDGGRLDTILDNADTKTNVKPSIPV